MTFARTFGDRYGKKFMQTATKTGVDAAKSISKNCRSNRRLLGNKVAGKITSVGKTKSK